MKKFFLFIKSFLAVPAVFALVYLISLPFYYFSFTWRDGAWSFILEGLFVCAFAAAGFFGFRGFDRVFRDDGSGDLYLWASLLTVIMILFAFPWRSSYAVNLSRQLNWGELKYEGDLFVHEWLTETALLDLMKFSSIYIITYAATLFLLLAMFGRALWNERKPETLAKRKLTRCEWMNWAKEGGNRKVTESDVKEAGNDSSKTKCCGEDENNFSCTKERVYILKKDWSQK